MSNFISNLGYRTRKSIDDIGYAARLFVSLVGALPRLLKRPRLITDQIFFIGNKSLVIICVSGLFVGFVLGLQGYYILVRYGSEQALGVLVALALTRELGPVVTALLYAGRAGTSLTAEIGLMKAGEQLAAMDMMAVNPVKRILAPRICSAVYWGVYLHADSGDTLQCGRSHWRIYCRRCTDWCGRRSVLVANAGRCRYLERYRQWCYQKPGFRIRGNIHGSVPGI